MNGDVLEIGHSIVIHRYTKGQFAKEAFLLGHGGYLPIDGHAKVPDDSEFHFYTLHASNMSTTQAWDLVMGGQNRPTGIHGPGTNMLNYRFSNDARDAHKIPGLLARAAIDINKADHGKKKLGFEVHPRDVITVKPARFLNMKTWGRKFGFTLQYVLKYVHKEHAYGRYHWCACRASPFKRLGNKGHVLYPEGLDDVLPNEAPPPMGR